MPSHSAVAGEMMPLPPGEDRKVTLTSSVDDAQPFFETVQRRVYVLPATPVKLLVGLAGALTVPPEPETIDHAPVPLAGVLADSATDVPHIF